MNELDQENKGILDPSYLTMLLQRVLDLPENTPAARRKAYVAFEAELLANLTAQGLPEYDKEAECRQLRQTIRLLEKDIRSGVNIAADGYLPGGILQTAVIRYNSDIPVSQAFTGFGGDATDAAIAEAFRESGAYAGGRHANISPLELTRDRLKHALLYLGEPEPHELPGPIRMIRAILIYQFHLIAGESRVAILWMMIQPAVLLALIGTMYLLSGTQYVMNMDVPTFALLGGGTWIMCRQVIFRVSTQMAHHRILINLAPISPLMQGVVQGLFYLLIYLVSMILLIGIGRLLYITALPDHLLGVLAYIFGMWVFALSFGFIFGTVAIFWSYFLRLASVLERAMQLFSSVFFVSEQLPEEYKSWILWCPTAHGMQLLRASYFNSYASIDASPSYFWIAIAILTFGTFMLERIVRPYVQPI